MSFKTLRRGGTIIVRADGRIDSRNAGELAACLPSAAETRSHVLIDLQGVDYMSSAGLRVLLQALKERQAAGLRLSCCGVQPALRQVFDITGLSTHLDLHDSQDAYFSRAVQVAKEVSEPASLQQRNKEAVLQFLMAIQFQQFTELSAVTFDGMTTTHAPSRLSEAAERKQRHRDRDPVHHRRGGHGGRAQHLDPQLRRWTVDDDAVHVVLPPARR